MPVHFADEEMDARLDRAVSAVAAAGLDGVLLFKQESMYWLSGYDTFGYSMFQCLVLRADGRRVLLTRMPDRGTAQYTSNLTDIRIWADEAGVDPAAELVKILAELGLRAGLVGIFSERQSGVFGVRCSVFGFRCSGGRGSVRAARMVKRISRLGRTEPSPPE